MLTLNNKQKPRSDESRRLDWDSYFFLLAHCVAMKSKDNRTKIGAVIVGKDNEILSTGYNSFPRGANDTLEYRQIPPEKYYWFSHAERNAIFNAAKNGIKLDGSTLYVTMMPCSSCALAIVQSGIKKVKVHKFSDVDVVDSSDIVRTNSIFSECGVEFDIVQKPLPSLKVMVRGVDYTTEVFKNILE